MFDKTKARVVHKTASSLLDRLDDAAVGTPDREATVRLTTSRMAEFALNWASASGLIRLLDARLYLDTARKGAQSVLDEASKLARERDPSTHNHLAAVAFRGTLDLTGLDLRTPTMVTGRIGNYDHGIAVPTALIDPESNRAARDIVVVGHTSGRGLEDAA